MLDGTKLGPFTIGVPYGWTDWMMREIVTENLKKIGIVCTTEFPDFSVWWERLSKGEFGLVIGRDAGPSFVHP